MRSISPSIVYIEACENYQKQSWRNRFRFDTPDGGQYFSIPIVHNRAVNEIPIREVQVDYSTPWIIREERALISAYKNSAYFDYYKDELFAILDSKPKLLFDLNLQIIDFFLRKTSIQAEIIPTKEYIKSYPDDYRDIIHPKKTNTILSDLGLEKPYFQVFADKHGFIRSMSILDLLFNEGPDSILWLKKI